MLNKANYAHKSFCQFKFKRKSKLRKIKIFDSSFAFFFKTSCLVQLGQILTCKRIKYVTIIRLAQQAQGVGTT